LTSARGALVTLVLGLVLIVGCADTNSESADQDPEPATAAEIAELCDRYDEVRDLEIGQMWTELIDVAPDEIRGSLVRLTAGAPGETYWDDRGIVEDYLNEHCSDGS
jgi:hypothetical protein